MKKDFVGRKIRIFETILIEKETIPRIFSNFSFWKKAKTELPEGGKEISLEKI